LKWFPTDNLTRSLRPAARQFGAGLAIGLLLVTTMAPAQADRSQFLPENNSDLVDVLEQVQKIKAAAAICKEMECPEIDCEAANELLKALREAEAYLRAMLPWMQGASGAYVEALGSISGQSQTTATNLSNTIMAQATQRFLHDFGSALLDIASVMSSLQDLATEGLKPENALDALNKLDGLYEAYKDAESLSKTLAGTGTPVGDLGSKADAASLTGDFNNDKSTLSDLLSIRSALRDAYNSGGNKALLDAFNNEALTPGNVKSTFRSGGAGAVRDTLTGRGGGSGGFFKGQKPTPWAAVGQIAGRYLKSYSEGQMQERAQRLAALERDLGAEQAAQTSVYDERREILLRSDAVEGLLSQVTSAWQELVGCMDKAKCTPSTLPRTVIPARHKVPDRMAITPRVTEQPLRRLTACWAT